MTETQLVILFLVLVIAYFGEHSVYALGVFRGIRSPKSDRIFEDVPIPNSEELARQPNVTALVCARDEEDTIEYCLESLSRLNYPIDKLELLIVDDKSTDSTPLILQEWQRTLPNLTVLRTGEEIGNLRGKVNALAQGMDVAKGEFVMITDADSHVNPEWINDYLRFYEKDTGMAASITLLDVNSFFDGVQSIDWAFLLGLAMACTNIDVPLSVIGNNISVRKTAYESVGGYREIPFSITEDYALFQAIWHKKPWKVKFPLSPGLLVMSQACPDLTSWWRQKHRWVKGGESLKALGYLIFILGLFGNSAMFLAPFILPPFAALIVIAIKWAADLLIILPVLARSKMNYLLKYFVAYEVYLFFFVLSMPVMIMQKNVKWKGRVYKH